MSKIFEFGGTHDIELEGAAIEVVVQAQIEK